MIDPEILYSLHSGPDVAARAEAGSRGDPILVLVADKDTAVIGELPRALDPSEGAGRTPPTQGNTSVEDSGGPGVTVRFPSLSEMTHGPTAEIVAAIEQWHEIARWQGRPVYALAVNSAQLDSLHAVPGFSRANFRELYLQISEVELGLLARAIQISDWYATSRYCSACGTPTEVAPQESVARCPACGHDQYPRLAPAMIVAVVRECKLLLARAPRFRGAFHSVLAGFVEPGESVEECVHREVFEEAKVRVKNVRYFGSQSWPFPHSLMLGFTAEWESGEIEIDGIELEHADWYAPDEMPPVPSELSISGRLIRWFRESCG